MLQHGAEVLPQSRQGNLRPCGAGRYTAQDFRSCRHWVDYSGSRAWTQVTLGLLPLGFRRQYRHTMANQFPASEKFTVICVSTSTGSLFKT